MLFSFTLSQPGGGSVGQVSDCTMAGDHDLRRPETRQTDRQVGGAGAGRLLQKERSRVLPAERPLESRPREIQIPSDWPAMAG